MWSNIRMEIENPKTAELIPLLGATNSQFKSMGALHLPDEMSFLMDWTQGGEGQEVLREHIRAGSRVRVKQQGKQYQGVPTDVGGMNTNDGMVVVRIA